MVIGQVVLISPLVTGLTISALNGAGPEIRDTAISLGAGRIRMAWTVILEVRYSVLNAVLIGFGRAVSEVGIAIMVGGNIYKYTRVLTTAIALETGKGDIELSMALGIILLGLALFVIIFAIVLPSWLRHKAGRSLQK